MKDLGHYINRAELAFKALALIACGVLFGSLWWP